MDEELQDKQYKSAEGELLYAGFKRRMHAATFDSVIYMMLIMLFMGSDSLIDPQMSKLLAESQQAISGEAMPSAAEERSNLEALLKYAFPKMIANSFIQMLLVACFVIPCWYYKGTTPGKAMLAMRIVDAKTHEKATLIQCVVRFIAYIISAIVLMFGFWAIGFDKEKRGWHDKIAGTVVLHTRDLDTQEEKDRKFKRDTIIVLIFIVSFIIFNLVR